MRTTYEVALSALLSLFFVSYYSVLGIDVRALPYYAGLTVVLAYALVGRNVMICERYIRERVVKPMVLDVDGELLHQEVDFSISYKSKIMVNVAGVFVPLVFTALGVAVMLLQGTLNLSAWLMLTLFLLVAYNRLTLFIRGKGLGVPIVTGVVVTVLTMLSAVYAGLVEPSSAFMTTFTSSVPAALVGIDIINLRNTAIYKARKVVIGGMGVADAVFLIPVMSSLIVGNITLFMGMT